MGEKFGRLEIIDFVGRSKNSTPIYKCRCECGREKNSLWTSLYTLRTKSCGCLQKEYRREFCKNHRGSKHPAWRGGRRSDKHGYIKLYVNHKFYILEHRFVWEKVNGPIPDGHDIHHLNGVKSDNRLENLCCVPKKRHGPYKILEPYQMRIKELERKLNESN